MSESTPRGAQLTRRSARTPKPNRFFHDEDDHHCSPRVSKKKRLDKCEREMDENYESLEKSPRTPKTSSQKVFRCSNTSRLKPAKTTNVNAKRVDHCPKEQLRKPRRRNSSPCSAVHMSKGGTHQADAQEISHLINSHASPIIRPPQEYLPDSYFDSTSDVEVDDTVLGKTVPDYRPAHFMRCHSGRDDPSDVQTELWSCQFQPDRRDVVATAGGRSVCLLDATSGILLKKFTHPSPTERLGVMTWMRIRLDAGSNNDRRISVLAVGGIDRVHLIHPDYLTWYKSFGVGQTRRCDITAMVAHPRCSRCLLVATGDGFISLWDVGVPTPPLYDVQPKLWLNLSISEPALSLVFVPNSDLLLAASDDGMVGWMLPKETIRSGIIPQDITYQLPLSSRNPKGDESAGNEVAALTILGKSHIAVKCIDRGCIYVWPLDALSQEATSCRVELPNTAHILPWSSTDTCYLGMYVGRSLLAAGDDQGGIWLYNWRGDMSNDDSGRGETQRLLKWPRPTDDELARVRKVPLHKFPILVHSVCLNQDESRLVAVTHNNMVCIWQRIDTQPETNLNLEESNVKTA